VNASVALHLLVIKTAAVALFASACGDPTRPPAGTSTMRFATARAGWAVGEDGLVMHTPDAGKTWTRQASFVTSDLRALAVAVASDGRFVGVAAGDAGALVRTRDGTTWRRVDASLSETLRSAATSANGSLLLVSGDTGTLLRSEDFGVSWASVAAGSANVTEVTLDARGDVAVAVDDAGATWESRDRARHFECVGGADDTLAQNLEH
jgi:photosystem II stability/assembly factor-like uncharacterized protein